MSSHNTSIMAKPDESIEYNARFRMIANDQLASKSRKTSVLDTRYGYTVRIIAQEHRGIKPGKW